MSAMSTLTGVRPWLTKHTKKYQTATNVHVYMHRLVLLSALLEKCFIAVGGSWCRSSLCSNYQQEMTDDGVLRPKWDIWIPPSMAQRTLLKKGNKNVRTGESVLCCKKMPQDRPWPLPVTSQQLQSHAQGLYKTRLLNILLREKGTQGPSQYWLMAVS